VSRSLETATQILSKNPGKFVGRISERKFRWVRKNDSFGEIQIGAETNLQSVFIIFYYTALEKYHPGVFHPYLVRIGGVET